MSSDSASHRLTLALRTASAQGLLISHAVSAKVGLNTTDLECLDVIQMASLASPGELARKTGLTTGAVTAVLDRLERAGCIKRQPDPNDRRRVLLAIQPDKMEALWRLYAPLQAAMEQLYGSYSDAELVTIAEFTERAAGVSAEFIRSLQEG
jgi:DNA-binding MarR family transcriptional regulator